MKVTFALLAIILSANSFAKSCFYDHLLTAIQRNQNRKAFYANPKYSKEDRRRANFIANSLIIGEKVALLSAKKFDKRAEHYQEQGLTVMCDELIDINDIRKPIVFKEPEGEQPEEFVSGEGLAIKHALKAAVKEDDLNKVLEIVQTNLDKLAQRPDYNCLMRNDLRTLLFIAQRIPHHAQKAAELGADDPRGLSMALIAKIATGLPIIDMYDHVAFPLQKKGISIICQDFPGARGKE